MLKSAGYFVSVRCPSFDQENKCNRPYCPFRHPSPEQPITNTECGNPLSIDAVNAAIAKIKSDLGCDTTAATVHSDQSIGDSLNEGAYTTELYPSYGTQSSAANLYTPGKASDNVVLNYYTNSKQKKSVLHGARGASKKKATKRQSSTNIYEMNINTGPISDMEYDPVNNYSTQLPDRDSTNSDDDSMPGTSKSECNAEDQVDPQSGSEDLKASEDLDDNDNLIIYEEQESNVKSNLFGTESDSDATALSSNIGQMQSNTNQSERQLSCTLASSMALSKDSPKTMEVVVISSSDEYGEPDEKSKVVSSKQKPAIRSGEAKTKASKKVKKSKNQNEAATAAGKIKNGAKKKRRSEGNKVKEPMKKKMRLVKRKRDSEECDSSSASDTLLATKDIDASYIANFIDQDEIKHLEHDLGGANTYEECLKIYHEGIANENKGDEMQNKDDQSSQDVGDIHAPTKETSAVNDDLAVVGKRRIAHANAATSALSNRKPVIKRKKISTPAQMMMRRLQIIEKEKAAALSSAVGTSGRTAHQPSAQAYVRATKTSKPSQSNLAHLERKIEDNPWYPKTANEPTVCGTATKGVARQAHKSKPAMAKNGQVIPDPPRIAVDRYSKVPTNIRQRYLTTFITECLRILKNDHREAYAMAKAEEERCKERSNTKNVYLSLAASTLKKLRDMAPGSNEKSGASNTNDKRNVTSTATKNKMSSQQKTTQKHTNSNFKRQSTKTMSHGDLLNVNTKKCKGGYTIEKKEERSELSAASLYEKLCTYIMTPEQLDENSYPRPGDTPGRAQFRCDPPLKPFNNTEKKICAHCGKEFLLDTKGRFKREEECIYHWGRAYMTKVGRGWEKRYSCCQERIGAEGCTVGDTHVHADNKLDRSGYVKTLEKSPPPDGNSGIYSLDCEMCYTVKGLELTRVSVIDHTCKLVYDTFVKPSGRVLDYNTRWSGITENDLKNVKTTIRDVQAVFLAKFSADTILMGHSLESDLVALRIIHETVIDTSIVFPHKRGLPYKRALRTLMSEILGIIIQNMASEGHDSTEDASACMKLMLWKVKEDEKLTSWKNK